MTLTYDTFSSKNLRGSEMFTEATEKIELSVGKQGTISVNVYSKCISIFKDHILYIHGIGEEI